MGSSINGKTNVQHWEWMGYNITMGNKMFSTEKECVPALLWAIQMFSTVKGMGNNITVGNKNDQHWEGLVHAIIVSTKTV